MKKIFRMDKLSRMQVVKILRSQIFANDAEFAKINPRENLSTQKWIHGRIN